MATVPHNLSRGLASGQPARRSDGNRRQRRRDRIVAGLVIAAMIALVALTVCLASLNGSSSTFDYDYWMMP